MGLLNKKQNPRLFHKKNSAGLVDLIVAFDNQILKCNENNGRNSQSKFFFSM